MMRMQLAQSKIRGASYHSKHHLRFVCVCVCVCTPVIRRDTVEHVWIVNQSVREIGVWYALVFIKVCVRPLFMFCLNCCHTSDMTCTLGLPHLSANTHIYAHTDIYRFPFFSLTICFFFFFCSFRQMKEKTFRRRLSQNG